MYTNRELTFLKQDVYCGKVLLGNWFEERCRFTRNPHDWSTTYNVAYIPKINLDQANDKELVSDINSKAEGFGPRIMFDHQAPHFLENKSTTYDLSYNHLTKLSNGPIPRHLRFRLGRYEPDQDFANNYGNITNYGLVDYYKEKWRGDIQDPRVTVTTTYQTSYTIPGREYLMTKRAATPLENTSPVDQINNLVNLPSNDVSFNLLPLNEIVQSVGQSHCNPITWECKDKLKQPMRCTTN